MDPIWYLKNKFILQINQLNLNESFQFILCLIDILFHFLVIEQPAEPVNSYEYNCNERLDLPWEENASVHQLLFLLCQPHLGIIISQGSILNLFLNADKIFIKGRCGCSMQRGFYVIGFHRSRFSMVVNLSWVFYLRPTQNIKITSSLFNHFYLKLSILQVSKTSTKGIRRVNKSQTSIILMYEVTGSPATTEMNMLVSTSITVRFTATADSK